MDNRKIQRVEKLAMRESGSRVVKRDNAKRDQVALSNLTIRTGFLPPMAVWRVGTAMQLAVGCSCASSYGTWKALESLRETGFPMELDGERHDRVLSGSADQRKTTSRVTVAAHW